MKVLQFLDSVNRGGAETQVLDLCRNAARFGIEVTFVTAGGGTMEDDFQNSGVEFIRLDRKLPIDLRLVSNLRRIIKERNIRIVHGYQAVEGLHLYLATRGLKGVKRVLSFQGFVPGRKNRIVSRMIASKMDANISVSRSLMAYLRDEIGIRRFDNFHVIYNGADEARLKPSGRSIKQELGLATDTILGAMVANFTADPTKDQITICRALPTVVERFPDFHFLFPGRVSADAQPTLTACQRACEAISGNAHFLGPRTDVPDILNELDVFVFSSRREGFPVALSEAMLAGVPVIVSDIEPLMEVLQGGELGSAFPVGDARTLGAKLCGLLADTHQRTALAEIARATAREKFSIDAHLLEMHCLYDSLIKRSETRNRDC